MQKNRIAVRLAIIYVLLCLVPTVIACTFMIGWEQRQVNAEIERRLLAAYGATKMIWAPGIKNQDITDYHIDSLARFTGPNRVLINLPDEPDSRDPFHMAALETHDALISAGVEVEVIPEPWERRVDSLDFVASYANYYVCNGAVKLTPMQGR